MAEFVEEQLEEQLPELEAITSAELLTSDEVLLVFKQRRSLEYKLQKRQKRLRDLQAYIQHEVGLLLLLRHRRHSKHYFFKKDRIEAPVVERLLRLHRFACHRFQHELPCWLAQVQFCELTGRLLHASKVWSRLLQVFPYREDLWQAAADWHWYDRIERQAARLLRRRRRRRRRDDQEALEARPAEEDLADTPRMLTDPKEVLACAELSRGFLLRGLRVNRNSCRLLLALLRLEAELSLWLHQLLRQLHRSLPAAAVIDEEAVLAAQPAELVLQALLDTQPGAGLLAQMADTVRCCPALAERCLPDLQRRMDTCQAEDRHQQQQQQQQQLVQAEDKDEQEEEKKEEEEEEEAAASSLTSALAEGGVSALRSRWRQLHSRSLPLLRHYLRLECSRQPISVRLLRSQLEEAAKDLGATSVDFWILYLQFEEQHGDLANVGDLDWRARKFLQPQLINQFNLARMYPQLMDSAV